MEKPLVLLVSLFLMLFFRGQNGMAPESCPPQQCPAYKLIEKNTDFEKRLYAASQWITTKVESTRTADVMAANSRLKNYCKRLNDAGYKIADDTWPVLFSVTEDNLLSMSWFVSPGTTLPENTDPSVILQKRPEAIVYVRSYGGTPSIQSGQENTNALWKALGKQCTNLPAHSGAGYESFFSLTHHNEIWIYAYDINCE